MATAPAAAAARVARATTAAPAEAAALLPALPLPLPFPIPVPDPTAPAPAPQNPNPNPNPNQSLFADATWILRLHRDAHRRAAKLAVQRRVVSVVKSMHGDVFGQVLYNALAGPSDKVDVTRVHARLNPGLVAMLVDVLRTDYDLHTLVPGRKYMVLPLPPPPHAAAAATTPAAAAMTAAAPTPLDFEPFELVLTSAYKDRWQAQPYELDVQQLSMDGWKVYLRQPLRPDAQPHPRANRLEYLLDRVQRRVFAAADPRAFRGGGGSRTSDGDSSGTDVDPAHAAAAAYVHAAKAYPRAYSYVRAGWTMDDAALGPRAFVVNRWAALPLACPHRCAAHASAADGVCPLCHETFQPQDIVVNLPCCHTFHCYCAPAAAAAATQHAHHGTGGLFAWLLDQGKDTCPVCRACLLLKGP
jgi:hypothetical protein